MISEIMELLWGGEFSCQIGKTHVKWALRLGIDKEVADFINKLIDTPEEVLRNDPTELGKLYRKDPESVKNILVSHDWGRKGKVRLDILKKYCYIRFGKKGVMAAELHHILDYIAYVRDPKYLAHMIISSLKFHATSGKSLMERIILIREYYHSKEYREQLRKLTNELVNLDYKSYREIIEKLIRNKAEE